MVSKEGQHLVHQYGGFCVAKGMEVKQAGSTLPFAEAKRISKSALQRLVFVVSRRMVY